MALLTVTSHGLYCPAGDFFIDPIRSVDRAVITHAHSDHARPGMRAYLTHDDGVSILRHRLGSTAVINGIAYGERRTINGVGISLHPAGHVVGSAQVRVEHKGEVWVVSGDYKRQDDPWAARFEPVRCHTFITESTFGMPIYRWPSNEAVSADIDRWWSGNAEDGRTSILNGYALGKAQRLLGMVDRSIGRVFVSDSVGRINDVLLQSGIPLPATERITRHTTVDDLRGALIISSGSNEEWIDRCTDPSTAFASGWMAVRGLRRRRSADLGFIVSDHVDWPDLLRTIGDTSAERVLVTHGFSSTVVRYLKEERGLAADELTILSGASEEDR